MSWAERLMNWGGGPSRGSVFQSVSSLYPALLIGADRIDEHAEQAPTKLVERRLRAMAVEDRNSAAVLREALRVVGTVPASPPKFAGPSGLNHWARLVRDLEFHEDITASLVPLANDVEEHSAALATALRSIHEQQQRQVLEIRDLIARADAQALN